MAKTKIEWCDYTINPVVGCQKCSPGCKHCYAERMANRLSHNPQTANKYAGIVDSNGHWTGYVSRPDFTVFDKLPKKPSRVFVGSMTDMFYFAKNDDRWWEGDVWGYWYDTLESRINSVFLECGHKHKQHTFMFLTKRPENMCQIAAVLNNGRLHHPNIWLGVTVCNQREADKKLPDLLQTPAALRFVSIEPMLEPIYISKNLQGIGWVICGGETGPYKRPFDPRWALEIQAQCEKAGVPFFYKLNSYGDMDGKLRREFPKPCREEQQNENA